MWTCIGSGSVSSSRRRITTWSSIPLLYATTPSSAIASSSLRKRMRRNGTETPSSFSGGPIQAGCRCSSGGSGGGGGGSKKLTFRPQGYDPPDGGGAADVRAAESSGARGDRSRDRGAPRPRTRTAARPDRADRLGELHVAEHPRGGRFRADEQVRRGLPRQAPLRRLRG